MDHLPHRNCHPAGSYCTDAALPPTYHPHHHHQHLHHHQIANNNNNSHLHHQHTTHPHLQLSHQQQHHQHQHQHQHQQQLHQHHPGDMRNLTPLDTTPLQPAPAPAASQHHHEMLATPATTPADASPYQQYQHQQAAAYHESSQYQHQNYQHHQLLDMHATNQQLDHRQAYHHHHQQQQHHHHHHSATPVTAGGGGYLAAATPEASGFEHALSAHSLASLPPVSQMRNPPPASNIYSIKSPTQQQHALPASQSPQQQHYNQLAHQAAYNGASQLHQPQPHHHLPRQYPATGAAHYGSPLPVQSIVYSPTNNSGLGLLATSNEQQQQQQHQGTNLSSKPQPTTTTTSATSTPASSISHDRLSSDSLKHNDSCNQAAVLPEELHPHHPSVLAYSPTTSHLSAASSLVHIEHHNNNNNNNNNGNKQMQVCLQDRLSADSLKQDTHTLKLADPQHHMLLQETQLNSMALKQHTQTTTTTTTTTYSPKQMNVSPVDQQAKQPQHPINEHLSGHNNQHNLTTNNKHLADTKLNSQLSQLHQHCAVLLDEQQHGGLMQAAAMNSPNNGTNASNSTQNNNNNNSTNNGNSSGRSKRLRTSFKHNQLKEMKRWFSRNQNPDAKDLKTLAQTTGLSKRVLQVWFQNARAKYRRNNAKGVVASQQLFDVNQHTPHLLQFQQHHQPPSQPQHQQQQQQQQQQHQQQNYYQHHSSRSLTVELEQQQQHHQVSSLTNQVVTGGQQAASSVVVVGSSVGPPAPLA